MTAAASTIETGNLEIKADVSIDDTGTVTGIAWPFGQPDSYGDLIEPSAFSFAPRVPMIVEHALLHTIGPEAVPGGQAIFAAKDSDQAKIAFEEAAGIIREDKRLVRATKIYGSKTGKRLINCDVKKSSLEVMSSDGGKAHGLSPTFILADELHVWKGHELWEALKSSRVKKRPLTIIASTAGAGNENLLYDEYVNACKIATGEKINPSYLPVLLMAEPSDAWDDPATWHKANPGLADGFVSIEEFENLVTDARDRPQERFAFLQYNLNIWQGASREPLFDMGIYDQGHDTNFDLADLETLPAYLGVDMSVNGDLTAIVAAWKHDDGRISMHPWFFVPGDDLTPNIPAFVRNVIETHMSVYQLDTFEKAASVFRYWSSFFEVMAEKAEENEV